MVLTISNAIYAQSLYIKLPFDIDTEFDPVYVLTRSTIGLAVPANFPANTPKIKVLAMAGTQRTSSQSLVPTFASTMDQVIKAAQIKTDP